MLLTDFRRHPKPLVGLTILGSSRKIPCYLKAYSKDIDDLGLYIGRHSLRKLLRVIIPDVVRVYKYEMGFGLV